jgi:hypothetical protein
MATAAGIAMNLDTAVGTMLDTLITISQPQDIFSVRSRFDNMLALVLGTVRRYLDRRSNVEQANDGIGSSPSPTMMSAISTTRHAGSSHLRTCSVQHAVLQAAGNIED